MGTNRWILGTMSGMVLVFALFTAALWKVGLFDHSGTEAGAKILASALGLVGGLVASLVAGVGVVLRFSIDKRNSDLREQAERRLEVETQRNATLREEGERRLKLEAAIKAIELLATSEKSEVPATQKAGVLFTLESLGLLDLALTMLDHMLGASQLDGRTAALVLEKALSSNKEHLQVMAAELLDTHAARLVSPIGAIGILLPVSLVGAWNPDWPLPARQSLAKGILRAVLSMPPKDWVREALNVPVATLVHLWRQEKNETLRNSVGVCLAQILVIYEDGYWMDAPSGRIEVDPVRAEISGQVAPDSEIWNSFGALRNKLEEWAGKDNRT